MNEFPEYGRMWRLSIDNVSGRDQAGQIEFLQMRIFYPDNIDG